MIDKTKKVWVYFNLHKKLFSVMQNGIVQGHYCHADLKDAEFVIRPAGQKKVREEKRKNVHAFVKGYWLGEFAPFDVGAGLPITYNPYKYDSFVAFKENSMIVERVDLAEYVSMDCDDRPPEIEAYRPSQKDGTKLQLDFWGDIEKIKD